MTAGATRSPAALGVHTLSTRLVIYRVGDRVADSLTDIVARPDAHRLTGRHTFDGFVIADGLQLPGGPIAGQGLHRVLAGG